MEIKGHLHSGTVVALLLSGLISLGQLIVNNVDVIEKALTGFIPPPWNAVVAPVLGLLVVILTVFGIKRRGSANTKLEGLW